MTWDGGTRLSGFESFYRKLITPEAVERSRETENADDTRGTLQVRTSRGEVMEIPRLGHGADTSSAVRLPVSR